MLFLKYLVIALLCIYAIILLVFVFRSRKPVKTLILTASVGLITLTVVNLLSSYTGVGLNVNVLTVGGSAVFGIPGVFSMLIIRMFF